MCNTHGRDAQGVLKVESVMSAIEALDGTQEDIKKVFLLDQIKAKNGNEGN